MYMYMYIHVCVCKSFREFFILKDLVFYMLLRINSPSELGSKYTSWQCIWYQTSEVALPWDRFLR